MLCCSSCWVYASGLKDRGIFEKYSWAVLKAWSETITAGRCPLHCLYVKKARPCNEPEARFQIFCKHVLLLTKADIIQRSASHCLEPWLTGAAVSRIAGISGKSE